MGLEVTGLGVEALSVAKTDENKCALHLNLKILAANGSFPK